ncbi:hypothetical protein K3495_g1134 [Podosphaera aphanis]|nr:hypothetical protein K3495_g1134 [Podosphaera aphanis]
MNSKGHSTDGSNHRCPRKRRKNSKWKILDGLFSRKKIALQSACVDEDDTTRSLPKHSSASISSHENNTVQPLKASVNSFLPPLNIPNEPRIPSIALPGNPSLPPLQPFLDSNSDDKNFLECTSPLLDIEIPTNRLDRFTIMFKEPLQKSNYIVNSNSEDEKSDSINLHDDSQAQSSRSLNDTTRNRPEYSSPYFEPQVSPLSQPPPTHKSIPLDIARTKNEPSFSQNNNERVLTGSKNQPLLTLEISNLFQEGEHENFFASTSNAMHPESRNTSSSSEYQTGAVSSPSTFGSGHNLSASTSLSSISPPQSATFISNQNKQIYLQSPQKTTPSPLGSYYSQIPSTNLSHRQSPISLQLDEAMTNPNLSSSSPASVVTKSPLDVFAQAANDDIERAAILLARSNTVKQLEKNHSPSKWSERLRQNSSTTSSSLTAVGEEESDEINPKKPIIWRINEDRETENKARNSAIKLKFIEHNTLTVPLNDIMKHRRSERAIVERMSFASNV